jgi:lipopolysaccharide export system protein LptA
MIHNGWPIFGLSALGLVMSWTAGLAQQPERTISFEAESASFDLRRGNSVFRRLSVSDGSVTIHAAEGTTTGNEANSGTLSFWDGVRVTINAGTLTADSGVFRFSEGQLGQGELVGDPVAFETRGEADDAAFHGTAGRIEYDGAQRTLSASDGASLTFGGTELTNCNWTYNFDDESAAAVAEGDGTCLARITKGTESLDQERVQ